MNEEDYRAWSQRLTQVKADAWRRHHQVAGRWQLVAGSTATLLAVCLLVPGASSYVDIVYRDRPGDVNWSLFIIGFAGVSLIVGATLSCMGYLKRRAAEKRTLTYDDFA